jgi:hypothetical protein
MSASSPAPHSRTAGTSGWNLTLQVETTSPPARSLSAQQQRFDRFDTCSTPSARTKRSASATEHLYERTRRETADPSVTRAMTHTRSMPVRELST